MRLTQEEFSYVKALAYTQFGIHLTDSKKSLIESRFSNIINAKGYTTFMQYFKNLEQDKSGEEMNEFINRLTTNHTYFFREEKHFDFLKDELLPELFKRESSSRDLRIWSAGCSSGEEAFTLAMIIDEMLGEKKKFWDTTILATDISHRVLEKANSGLYPKEELEKIANKYTQKYFIQKGQQYQVTSYLKKEVVFRKFNLTHTFNFKNSSVFLLQRSIFVTNNKSFSLK